MQRQWLESHPSAALKVYAVWLPMLFTDSRGAWDGNTMPDPRVRHFWDGGRAVGAWFAEHVDGFEGVAWDVYYLYGPEATWEDVPAPRIASGGTIYGQRDLLGAHLVSITGE